ncbi:MAG: hypothetical protein WCK51_15630 [Armatimonadota bacterium]
MTAAPLSLEQWLSYVLALPSHRSSNESHRTFGARIVKLVYDEIPAQFADDVTARNYFNHMLAEVAWAVRGFSAVRDDFQRQVQARAFHAEHAKERAKGWTELSPLRKESLGSKGLSIAVGAGGATALSHLFPSIPIGWNVALVIVLAYTVHLFLDWLQSTAVKRALANEPREVMDAWSDNARPQYEAIARAFLEKAWAIESRFYPPSDASVPPNFEQLIQRAMEFGRPENPAQ